MVISTIFELKSFDVQAALKKPPAALCGAQYVQWIG
jgi:hypothetical protein